MPEPKPHPATAKRESVHQTPADTRARSYERLRETGIPAAPAKAIAEQAARQVHENQNKRR